MSPVAILLFTVFALHTMVTSEDPPVDTQIDKEKKTLLTFINKKKLPSVASGAASKVGKLIFFQGGINYGFELEDLLKADAEVLEKGSFGISYKQVLKEKKKKKTVVMTLRLKDVVVTENEFKEKMEVLGNMKNENVVPLIAYNYSQVEKFLVYDYMADATLSALLHGSKCPGRTQLDWDHRMRIASAAARGLAYLHLPGKVVHGNIESSNILLGQETNNEASVSHYGLNTIFGGSSSVNNGYWAPEVCEGQNVTIESDVYSFGVLLLELLTGKTPEQAPSSKGKRSKWVESIVCEEPKTEIFDVELTRRGRNIEEMVQLLRIAKDCVSIRPDERPRMHDIVSMMEDMWLRPSSDDHSKGYDFTPSTDTRDTPSTSTITP